MRGAGQHRCLRTARGPVVEELEHIIPIDIAVTVPVGSGIARRPDAEEGDDVAGVREAALTPSVTG